MFAEILHFTSLTSSLTQTDCYHQNSSCTSLNSRLSHPHSSGNITSHLCASCFPPLSLVQLCFHTPSYAKTNILFGSLSFWQKDFCEDSDIFCDGCFLKQLLLDSVIKNQAALWWIVIWVFWISIIVPYKISSCNHSFIPLWSPALLHVLQDSALFCRLRQWLDSLSSQPLLDRLLYFHPLWLRYNRESFGFYNMTRSLSRRRMVETACATWLCLTDVSDAAHGLWFYVFLTKH